MKRQPLILDTNDDTWRDRAACRGMGPDQFFAEAARSATNLEARRVCTTCPVAGPCLNYALATHQDWGIWGGTSIIDRKEIRRARRQAKA